MGTSADRSARDGLARLVVGRGGDGDECCDDDDDDDGDDDGDDGGGGGGGAGAGAGGEEEEEEEEIGGRTIGGNGGRAIAAIWSWSFWFDFHVFHRTTVPTQQRRMTSTNFFFSEDFIV